MASALSGEAAGEGERAASGGDGAGQRGAAGVPEPASCVCCTGACYACCCMHGCTDGLWFYMIH